MIAPVMPHVTEEIHSLFFAGKEGVESIHVSSWPVARAEWTDAQALEAGELALAVIEGMRKTKSIAKVSVAAPVGTLTVACDGATWEKIRPLSQELLDVSNAKRLERVEMPGTGFVETGVPGVHVGVELAGEDGAAPPRRSVA
jgi:valyl-tRNA synthetase